MKKFCIVFLILLISELSWAQSSRFDDEEQPKKENTSDSGIKAPSQQQQSKASFWQRTRFGGNLGVQFGTFTYVNVSPRMYYLVTEKLWVGAGITFIYSKDNYNYGYPVPNEYREQFVYGLNLFSTYQLIGPVFVQAEYEPLSFEKYSRNSFGEIVGEDRVWVHNLFLGGGITQRVGRGAVFLSVLYNVTYSNSFDSYYSSPWVFRIGFGL